jgi:hypothetical protein
MPRRHSPAAGVCSDRHCSSLRAHSPRCSGIRPHTVLSRPCRRVPRGTPRADSRRARARIGGWTDRKGAPFHRRRRRHTRSGRPRWSCRTRSGLPDSRRRCSLSAAGTPRRCTDRARHSCGRRHRSSSDLRGPPRRIRHHARRQAVRRPSLRRRWESRRSRQCKSPRMGSRRSSGTARPEGSTRTPL